MSPSSPETDSLQWPCDRVTDQLKHCCPSTPEWELLAARLCQLAIDVEVAEEPWLYRQPHPHL
jgi:hypothetical protein